MPTIDDAAYAAQTARLTALRDRWFEPLGLYEWRIKFGYHRDYLVDAAQNADVESVGRVAVRWEYRDARIDWNLPEVADCADDELEWAFLHECMHILLAEMRDRGAKHEERVASTLAHAFLTVRAQEADDATNEAGTEQAPGGEAAAGPRAVRGGWRHGGT